MAKPRKEVERDTYYQNIHFLYEIISSFKNTKELKMFLKDILTTSELRMLKRRWHIAKLLSADIDIRTIANITETSTQTVMRIKQKMEEGRGGYKVALMRMSALKKKELEQIAKKYAKGGSTFIKGWFK